MIREEREDAIDIIQSILDKYEEDECLVTEITIGDEDIKAFKVAIKALEQESTTKNDLAVDAVSRADVLKLMQDNWHTHNGDWAMQESMDDIRALPSVTPQEPKEITLEDVKEYCKPRCLTIISNGLLYELTHPKIKALEQEPVIDKIRAEVKK